MSHNLGRTAQEEHEEWTRARLPYSSSLAADQVVSASRLVEGTSGRPLFSGSTSSADEFGVGSTGRGASLARTPLRVVHVGPCMLRGGAERWLSDLVRFLDPERVELVRAIATRPDQIDLDLVSGLRFPVSVGQADVVRSAASQCDVLLAWGLELNDLLGDVRPPLSIYLAHGDGEWTNRMLRGSDKVVDHVVAVSRRVADRCCQGFPATVIWNGVDSARLGCTQPRETTRAALGVGPGDFLLGYVGRFSPEKNVHVLVEAVAALPAHFKLLLVGWGPLRNDLMELANQRIPGRYAFATAWDYLGDYYRAMDAMGLVSGQEGFPLVLLEAMHCGCPTIVTSVGSAPEVIRDRINGLIVSGDPASVAAAAELLVRHPAWARALGAEGRTFADQYGHARRMARDYENLFHRLWNDKYPQGQPVCGSSQ